jgi:NAD(P)-dependent dehydrogenase (short-subunit alcohol dehydrogenase family)
VPAPDLFRLDGRTALVTGGSSGIGAAVAAELLRAGARVLVCARNPDDRDATAARLADLGPVEAIPADLATTAGVAALTDAVRARVDALHLLVNCAGTTRGGGLDGVSEAEWDATFDLNVKAAHYLTTALRPLLVAGATAERPSGVVHIGSMDGLSPQTGNPAYAASKAALHHLTRVHARAMAAAGITVNALAPGVFPSRLTASVLDDGGQRAQLEAVIPLGRIGRPAEIGGTVVYLASRAGAFTTGTVLAVDGGITGCGLAGDR